MPFEVLMPPLSQTLDTLVLVEWLKRAGEPVSKGEPLFLVESDKATLEVEAPASGVLATVLVEPGVEVRVKTPIALITVAGETVASPPRRSFAPLPPARLQRIAASPRARALAQQEGIDLAAVRASGPEGMIVERDVKAYAAAAARVTPSLPSLKRRVSRLSRGAWPLPPGSTSRRWHRRKVGGALRAATWRPRCGLQRKRPKRGSR